MQHQKTARDIGQEHLRNRRPTIIGFSPGNSFYYKYENLQHILSFVDGNSDMVFVLFPQVIGEHNYRAVGSKNPTRSTRKQSHMVRNKVQSIIKNTGDPEKFHYVDWMGEIEASEYYHQELKNIMQLYENNALFRADVRDSTEHALISLMAIRKVEDKSSKAYDVDEGVLYLLKELAFILAFPSIYNSSPEYTVFYHREWPILEKFLVGYYDGIKRPNVGFVNL